MSIARKATSVLDRQQSSYAGPAVLQGLLEDLQAERQVKEAEEIPEVDEAGKKLTKKQQTAAKKKAEAERTKQTQDEGSRIDPKASFNAMCLSLLVLSPSLLPA